MNDHELLHDYHSTGSQSAFTQYLGGNDNAAMKLFQNVTLLVPDTGAMQKLEREAPMRVVAHSINAFQSADGRWSRLYLHADGHVKERHHASADEIWMGHSHSIRINRHAQWRRRGKGKISSYTFYLIALR